MQNPSQGPLRYDRRGHRIDFKPWKDEDVNRVVIIVVGLLLVAGGVLTYGTMLVEGPLFP